MVEFWLSTLSGLEAQQRHLSYLPILVAIVSQNAFVLIFLGYRTLIARYVAKWGIAQMCLCELSTKAGVSPFGGSAILSLSLSLFKSLAQDGVSQRWYRSIARYGATELSKFSRISRRWAFWRRPLFQETPFCRTRDNLEF